MDPDEHSGIDAGEASSAEDDASNVGESSYAPEAADQRRWWRVNCRDAVHNPRSLTVLVNRDRVVLIGPPGDTALLTSGQVGQLSRALHEAADQAGK